MKTKYNVVLIDEIHMQPLNANPTHFFIGQFWQAFDTYEDAERCIEQNITKHRKFQIIKTYEA